MNEQKYDEVQADPTLQYPPPGLPGAVPGVPGVGGVQMQPMMPGIQPNMLQQPGVVDPSQLQAAPGFQPFQPMMLPGSATFNPMAYAANALQSQGLQLHGESLARHLSVTDRVEAVKEAAAKAKRGIDWRKKQEWYYAIKLPGFRKGGESQAEINFKRILYHITEMFGDDPKVEGEGVIHRPFCARAQGRADQAHAYIRITASVYRMEQWAEQDKMRVRVRKHLGGGFHFFSIREKAQNAYSHPQTLASTSAALDFDTEEDEDTDTTKHEICKHQRADGTCGCNVFMPFQRQQMIKKRLETVFDKIMKRKDGSGIQAAIDGEIIASVVPLHTLRKPDEFYKSRREIYEDYCHWRTFLRSPWTWTKWNRRYVSWLHDYFGSKLATYFAFLHFYTVALLILSIFGVALQSYQWAVQTDVGYGVLLYAIFCAFWGTLFLEFWNRKNAAWSSRWDTIDFEQREEIMPEFSRGKDRSYGFYERRGAWVDLADYTKLAQGKFIGIEEFIPKSVEETVHPWWRSFKEAINMSVTIVFMFCVIVLTVALITFKVILQNSGSMSVLSAGIVGGMLNALSIAILDQVWIKIAVKLNDWENHRTRTTYEDKLILKVFCFQFVNAYTSLFYLAFWKGTAASKGNTIFSNTEDTCEQESGCVADLAQQLAVLLVMRLVIQNTTELAVPYLKATINIWKAKRGSLSAEEQKKRKLKPLYVEKQAGLATYDRGSVPGTFYDYNELAIQFGYVVLFAPAFPLAPFLALLNNIVESATDGVKMLFDTQRPPTQEAADIGTWYSIFRFVAVLAVITNALIVAFTSDQLTDVFNLDEDSAFEKLLIVVIAEHMVLAIQFLISRTIPNRPPWLRQQLERTQSIERIEKNYGDYINRVGGIGAQEDDTAEHDAIMNVEIEYDEDDDSDSDVDDDGIGLAAMQYDEEDSKTHDV